MTNIEKIETCLGLHGFDRLPDGSYRKNSGDYPVQIVGIAEENEQLVISYALETSAVCYRAQKFLEFATKGKFTAQRYSRQEKAVIGSDGPIGKVPRDLDEILGPLISVRRHDSE